MMIIQIAGRLGRDPETRFTPSGQKVTTFTVATNVKKGGKDETVWWRVTIWGDRFDKLMPYLKKGSAVIIVGEMNKPDIWTDKEGRPQVSLEITAEIIRFSPFGNPDRPQEGGGSQASQSTYPQTSYPQSKNGGSEQSAADFNSYSGFSSGATQGSASPGFQEDDPLPF